jgi:hypothetical protein
MKKATTTKSSANSTAAKAPKKSAAIKKAVTSRKSSAKNAASTELAAGSLPAAAPAAAALPPSPPAVLAPVRSVRAAMPALTEIQANVDVGFGNTLYIRGEGPGLSWDRGVPMDCTKDDLWSYTVLSSARPIVFKFLLNDEIWCTGDDYVVEPGRKITLVPTF